MNIRNFSLPILLLLCFTCVVSMQAQDEGGSSFGIRAGVNFQNINGKDDNGDKLTNNLVTRYHAGIQMDIPIVPDFYFQPGLVFTTKGAKEETTILEQNVTATINLAYVELPLHFIYKPLLGNGHLILGFGPYVGYAVGGKAKYESVGLNSEDKIKFQNKVDITEANEAPYFKPLDVGADLLFGYQMSSGLFFQLNAQLGLVKINPEYSFVTNDKSVYKNTGFGLSVGYQF